MNISRYLVALFTITFLAAGCAPDDGSVESPDGRDEVAFPGGKADSLYGECEINALLDHLNNPETAQADLEDNGVHGRAAGNIIDYRNGADGEAGTDDDETFETVKEVDDVYWVGPVGMRQLFNIVVDRCVVEASQTEVIFSPQDYDDSHLTRIVELIEDAEESIDIAMYSLSDAQVNDALEDAVDRGVSVRMIFEPAQSDRLDPEGTRSARIERLGVDVRYVNKIMHHKYAIIDGPREAVSQNSTDKGILVTGSGNWSWGAATRYDENTAIIFGNSELNLRFQREFNTLWNHSRDFSHVEEFTYFESDEITEEMIPEDPSVDAKFTSANFRQYVSSRYGNTFGVVRGRNEIANEIVRLIEEADESIWVASGHLRSRPVSEALLAKHEANPDMDIKVYLDGQEYVSWWAHNEEVDELEDCLEEAGDSDAKQQDCVDKGYHFSFDIHQAGIDQRFKFYSYYWHYSYAKQMHHKYIILDGEKVISGSYNLSDNAEHNTMENIVIYDASGFPDLVEQFKQNFQSIWNTGEGEYEAFLDEVENGDGDVPIVFDSMAINWDQVDQLKDAIADACPDLFSTEHRRHPERHRFCER